MKRVPHSIAAEQWRDRLEKFKDSGLTIERFCQSEGVSAGSFYRWRKRIVSQEECGKSGFARALITQPSQAAEDVSTPSVRIELPGGANVYVEAVNGDEILRQSIAAVVDATRPEINE